MYIVCQKKKTGAGGYHQCVFNESCRGQSIAGRWEAEAKGCCGFKASQESPNQTLIQQEEK